MSDHLTPVQVCEKLIGPLAELERIAGYRPKTAYAWLRSSMERQAGDLPSVRLMQCFLAHARARGIPLTADHLIWGAPRDEIDELLAAMPARILPSDIGAPDVGPAAIQAAE
jgi:hypothetical protein